MKKIDELAKHQAVYIGHKEDMVDLELAKYINNYPERKQMKILFLRESEGVYQFGSKRIFIKIDKGD